MQPADIVLIAHLLFVLFVIGSLPVIWIGAYFKQPFARNPWFRYLHLVAILFVVAESLLGVVCPLTTLENSLRQVETESSFIQFWVHKILFYRFPEYIFTLIYIVFASVVAATFKWIPPKRH